MLRPEPLRVLPASTSGLLISLGSYPALIPGPTPVAGEWFEYAPPLDDLLRRLDRIEGSAYRRVLRPVDVAGLGLRPAWLYEWARAVDAGPVIPSGDWMER
jgi:gamma-glutamylcyclotransferase (GGCT)/AIG2-like uncharacterized protein YtfP